MPHPGGQPTKAESVASATICWMSTKSRRHIVSGKESSEAALTPMSRRVMSQSLTARIETLFTPYFLAAPLALSEMNW